MTDWDEIVHSCGPAVWRTVYRLLNDHTDSADCYQRVFLEAVEVSRREPVRNWPALLRRLATVRALDMLRQRYRPAAQLEQLDRPDSVPSRQSGPQQAARETELTDQLRQALAELPARQAEVFCAVAIDGSTYREVGQELGLATPAVGMLMHRARLHLRTKFAALAPINERSG